LKNSDLFFHCRIELFIFQNIIENIKKETKKQKEFTNKELRTIFAPTVIFQKIEAKKKSKRFFITNKVIISEKMVTIL
jgi:hypothetical protein